MDRSTARKKKDKPAPLFHAISFLHCRTCGESYQVATEYMRVMVKDHMAKCTFCDSANVEEWSPDRWRLHIYETQRGPGWAAPKSMYAWDVGSFSTPGVTYTVELLPGDIYTCTCKGFELACIKHNSDCIHISKVRSITKVTRPHEEVCEGRVLACQIARHS